MQKKSNSKNELTWKPVSKKTLLETAIFKVEEIESISPESKIKKFINLNTSNWVLVVPEIINEKGEKCFLMVEQWRHGAERIFIEFPGGLIDAGETPDEAAKRELLEETGHKASKITLLTELYPNPAIMQNKFFVFSAECSLETQELNLDEDEFLKVIMQPVNEVIANLGKKPYDHALMSSAALQYVKRNPSNV